jgi:hypothetical protein
MQCSRYHVDVVTNAPSGKRNSNTEDPGRPRRDLPDDTGACPGRNQENHEDGTLVGLAEGEVVVEDDEEDNDGGAAEAAEDDKRLDKGTDMAFSLAAAAAVGRLRLGDISECIIV